MVATESGNEVSTKRENHFLRLLCAVFIICVVIVHYCPSASLFGYNVGALIHLVGRFAMPVFFMISGYYLFSKDGHSENDIPRKVKRLIILLVFLKVFYTLLDVALAAFSVIEWEDVIDNLIIGDSTLHIWFVLFLIIVYIVHYFVHRYNIDFKYLLPFSITFLFADVLFADLLPVFGVEYFMGVRCCNIGADLYALIAFFFFQAGYYIHKHKSKIDTILSNNAIIILLICGMALNLFEGITCIDNGTYTGGPEPHPNMTIGTIIFALAIFIGSFRLGENHLRCRPLEWMGRNIMGWMYVFVAAGSYPLKLIYFNSIQYTDMFMYNVVGLGLSILIDIALALLVFFILTKLSERKKVKANPV